MPPTLSICIPTHDGRAGTLAYGLDTALSQSGTGVDSRVEICVSDNASADGTQGLVRDLAAGSPVPIRYRRSEVDLGPGPNILSAIDMATGDYCWLLSSDDALAPGAIERMLELLVEHPGVGGVSTAYQVFDHLMEHPLPVPPELFPPGDQPRVIEGSSAIVEELGPYFIGVSLQVVDRVAWLEVARTHRGSPLVRGMVPHVLFLTGVASGQPRWLWCPKPLVRWRAGREMRERIDGFMAGLLDDLAASLSAHLDPRDPGYRRALARFAHTTYAPQALRNMSTFPTHTARDRRRLIRVMVKRLYWLPDFWWRMAPSLLLPSVAVRAARRARRLARSVS